MIAWVLITALAGAGPPSCEMLEREVWNRLEISAATEEPEGARAMVYDEATDNGQRCPSSEKIAYIRLRTLELGVGDARLAAQRSALGQTLAGAFQRSARIATVRARIEKSTELARRAASLDPGYAPAQVALASLLLAGGDAAGAQVAIERLAKPGTTDDGFAVLARIRWAQGDADGAIQAARRELTGREESVEPGEGPPEQAAIDEAHEILGLAYLKKVDPDHAAPHLLAASRAGSYRARQAVKNADPSLKRALARARRARSP